MAPFKELYGRRCRSLVWWFKVEKSLILGPEMVYKALEKVRMIRDRLKMEYARQKSYANNGIRDHEFELGDKVYLKNSPMKVVRFAKKEEAYSLVCGPL